MHSVKYYKKLKMLLKIKRKHKYDHEHDEPALGNTGLNQSLNGNI